MLREVVAGFGALWGNMCKLKGVSACEDELFYVQQPPVIVFAWPGVLPLISSFCERILIRKGDTRQNFLCHALE